MSEENRRILRIVLDAYGVAVLTVFFIGLVAWRFDFFSYLKFIISL